MSDTAALILARRCIRLSARNIYLFGGAIDTGTEYVTYVVPGVILLSAGFGSATTAVTVSQDVTGGIVDRFPSMDVGGAAILAGHVAASALRNAASTVLVFGVAFAIGFRPHAAPVDWLAARARRSARPRGRRWRGAPASSLSRPRLGRAVPAADRMTRFSVRSTW
jgi:ABC-2 type transport system permease protein